MARLPANVKERLQYKPHPPHPDYKPSTRKQWSEFEQQERERAARLGDTSPTNHPAQGNRDVIGNAMNTRRVEDQAVNASGVAYVPLNPGADSYDQEHLESFYEQITQDTPEGEVTGMLERNNVLDRQA